jgi:hypothetical protein
MKDTGISLGTVSMLVGLVMCVVKAGGAGLAAWPWWVVTAPLWGPFVAFGIFMLVVSGVIFARTGADSAAEKLFDAEDDDEFTEEEQRKFRRWLEKYGDV